MAYETINELVKNEQNPAEYSLDFEFGNDEYKQLSPIDRYFVYGVSRSVYRVLEDETVKKFYEESLSKFGELPDCDGSDGYNTLIKDVYNKLWGFKTKGRSKYANIVGFDYEFGADTMNSFLTTYNSAMKMIISDNDTFIPYRIGRVTRLRCYQVYCNSRGELLTELDKIEKLVEFSHLYHSMGNMVLVPSGFNTGRYSKTKDYWDSSLLLLKNEGFVCKDGSEFKKEDFTGYINYFFLWDYVSADNGEYKVKPLFISENNEEFCINISSYAECKQFFKNVCSFINNRGRFMSGLIRMIGSENSEISELGSRFLAIIQSDDFLNTVHEAPYTECLKAFEKLTDEMNVEQNEEYKRVLSDLKFAVK